MKPRITVIITRATIGGAQKYVLSMIEELHMTYDFNVITGSTGFLSDALTELNVPVTVIPAINSLNPVKAIWRLRKSLKQNPAKLINTHSSLASIYARIANWRLNTPLTYSIHGWFFAENTSPIRQTIGPLIERILASFTTNWITETKFDQDLGISKGTILSREQSTVIPNAIPQPKTVVLEKYTQNKKTFNLVFVGRISYQKNPLLAIDVLSKLPSNFTMTMFCDNRCEPELINRISQRGVTERITLIDNEKETSRILHHYDLYLMTSRYEGMPLSVIEAMSSGLPIVSSNICGLSELVSNNENGYLINDFQAKSFAEKIINIAKSDELQQSMSQASITLYQTHHTLHVMAKRISNSFNKTMNEYYK